MGVSFLSFNGARPTTAATAKVATGTAIKTMLQLAIPAGVIARVKEWGISFDGSAAATPGICELLQTDVGGTITQYTANDLMSFNEQNGPTSLMDISGTGKSGYTCTSEGSITATRVFDTQLLPPTAPYVKQWPLGQEPQVGPSKFLRVRVTFGTTVNALVYVIWEEN